MGIEMVIDVITVVLVVTGLIFFLGTALGVLRFPDYYTRVHAAGKGDTLSSMVIVLALAIYNLHDFSFDNLLVSLKIGLIIVFIFITSPTTAHALIEAGYLHGVKPWTRGGDTEEEPEVIADPKTEDNAGAMPVENGSGEVKP